MNANHKSQPSTHTLLDRYLPERLRVQIEQAYYAKVNQQAVLDVVARNPEFLADPMRHVALYSDHGVVHVRDVANNILTVLDMSNGVLIPLRDERTFQFMQGYGVLLAYNHDIGMMDFSAYGRAMHPEFAAQAVFSAAYDTLVETIWQENWGNLAWRLLNLLNQGVLAGDPKRTLRELLAMSIGHSKSKVPIETLNDPQKLRAVMLTSVGSDLQTLYCEQQVSKAEMGLRKAQKGDDKTKVEAATQNLARAKTKLVERLAQGQEHKNCAALKHYEDFSHQAFTWLTDEHPLLRALVADVTDTLRALRVADALRQRGTTLKTSGGYAIFVDQNNAKAIIALQKGSGEALLLQSDDPLSIGEANMASSELTSEGDLRLSFHRGSFASERATHDAARCCAVVIDDVQRDTIESFIRFEDSPMIKSSDEIRILIEETDDNLAFAELILCELRQISPASAQRARIVPSLKLVSASERKRYLSAASVAFTPAQQEQILLRMRDAGHKIDKVNTTVAFTDVRQTELRAGEVLIAAGSPPGFVYVPMGAGLVSLPEGGYTPHAVSPWIPLGNTRVIRGDVQEATITAEQDLKLLMLPKEIYLKYWHDTYNETEFAQAIQRMYAKEEERAMQHALLILEQLAMLDGKLEESEIEFVQKFLHALGQTHSAAEIRQKLLTNSVPDVAQLRQHTLDYLALQPPFLQVSQLRDLANLLVRADGDVAEEERLLLGELNGLLGQYLEEDGSHTLYGVYIVPQSDEQDRALLSLLAGATRWERSHGYAYPCGVFHSLDYAEMIRERYRQLGFFAVVEEETTA